MVQVKQRYSSSSPVSDMEASSSSRPVTLNCFSSWAKIRGRTAVYCFQVLNEGWGINPINSNKLKYGLVYIMLKSNYATAL